MDWLSLFLVAVLIAIAYLQTIHGFFSTAIMCVLTLLCAVLAFATHQWVAFSFLIGPLGDLALPVAFAGTFVIPLIVLRVAMDTWISRSPLVPLLIDRACGAAAGLITAFMITGMLAISIQMLPLGGSFLGHTGLDPETGEESGMWLGPDRFAATFASMMSDGLLSGRTSFSESHPDFVQETIWAQTGPNGVRHLAPPGSIRLVHVQYPDYIFKKTVKNKNRRRGVPVDATYDRLDPPAGKKWYLVRLSLEPEAADESSRHRFTRRQVRLVGRETPGEPAAQLAPVAMNDNDRPKLAVQIGDDKLYTTGDGSEVDFVFEVGSEFSPLFIEYMQGARADLTSATPQDDFTPEAVESAPAVESGGDSSANAGRRDSRRSSRRRGDRVSGVRATRISRFGDDLPLTMTRYQSFDLEEVRGALAAGHVYGNVDEQGDGSAVRLTKFEVPPDKRLFQLEVEQLRARSGIGKVLSFAVTTAQQYNLRDDRGSIYPVVGQYAIANVGGAEVIEIQYFPEAVAVSNRGGIRDFRKIRPKQLESRSARLVYLFLVEPGARITQFSTGRRPTDLTDLDLVAPN